MGINFPNFSCIFKLAFVLSGGLWLAGESITNQVAQTAPVASVGSSVSFSCSDSEATIKAKNGPKVTFGTTTIYIGYQQVSSTNQNPRLARFDNGVRTWCKSDYEVTNDDGTGYGLIWDGESVLYGVFSATGAQGLPSQDFRRFATSGWLTSYGVGGGPRIAIVAQINPATGNVARATFLRSVRSDGKTNSLRVKGLSWTGTSLVVNANSWYSPLKPNKTRMSCSGSSPFDYTVELAANLSSVVQARADRCS